MTARIFHADLYGTRAHKYDTLLNSDIESIDWQEIVPNQPFYLFRPQEQALRAEYELGWKVTDIFPINVLGFQTHRDQFAIDFDENVLKTRIADFYNTNLSDDELRSRHSLGNWDVGRARNKLRVENNWLAALTKCSYRPFDTRYYFAHSAVVDRMRTELAKNMTNRQNFALNLPRQTKSETWRHAYVSNLPTPAVFIEIKDGSTVFPLWLYPQEGTLEVEPERRPNLSPTFIAELTAIIGVASEPESIFHYAYAVFHAPSYRERYAPFLKIDFPRLPFPQDFDSFQALAKIGEKLVALHLMEASELDRSEIKFPVHGDHVVKKMRVAERYLPPAPNEQNGRVHLNDREYFDNVPTEAWEFRVGGYQPAFKWLDDRAGRTLSTDEITHYARMIAAMRETVALLPELDRAFQNML